jgi:alkanesulfonate monooxygenase SsuD/methylene tetrahydromethanopterin reductase-like flavin-dependent oxidoreductase (luciferase family)
VGGFDMDAIRTVAQRAEAYGFRDLWVTENTFDHVNSFDPVVVRYQPHPRRRLRSRAARA